MAPSGIHTLFNRAQIDDRQVNELIGIARGISADRLVNQSEADYLYKWLVANQACNSNPVVAALLVRVKEMLVDGNLDEAEAAELQETLHNFSAGDFEIGELLKSTTLPVDNPQPDILFSGQRFCFTGTFAFGSRKDCEAAVQDRGGSAGPLSQKTNYLVIGAYATDSWAHSTFGRKIEQAVEWRSAGVPIAIIAEPHWASAV